MTEATSVPSSAGSGGAAPQGSDPGGSGNPAAGSGGGPVLGLLARGLELWLRQQCSGIERLEIRLEGSALRLLQGRLDGVSLTARRVVYQDMEIELVELHSDPIRVRMAPLLRSQSFQLEDSFQIRGRVTFSGEGLSRSLATPQWRSLGDALAEDLLGLSPLSDLRIQEDTLVLRATGAADGAPVERATRVLVHDGSLELQALEGGTRSRLPMDPDISIDTVEVGGGVLELFGAARVLP